MNRRNFIKTGSVAGLSITSIAIASCNTNTGNEKKDVGDANATPFADDFELNEITIDQLQQKKQKGDYTSRSVTELYLKRIDGIDKKGPALNAVIELNPDALTIA